MTARIVALALLCVVAGCGGSSKPSGDEAAFNADEQAYVGKLQKLCNEAKAFRQSGKELKDTPFLQLAGPDYIETSFRAAAAADPDALLIYNENHVEYDIHEDEYGRTTLLKLLKRFSASKVPIGALGIQSHLRTGGVPFNGPKFKDFLSQVSDLGFKIVISELDVTEKGPETNIADRDPHRDRSWRTFGDRQPRGHRHHRDPDAAPRHPHR